MRGRLVVAVVLRAGRAGQGTTSAKHAVRAISRTLRLELLGKPVRVTEVDPGMVETEFSQVRFHGDQERASAVYRGLRPLSGEDVADCVVWAATRHTAQSRVSGIRWVTVHPAPRVRRPGW